MIKFESLKFVLYDFDDTLCIHSWHGDSKDDTHLYNINVLLNGKDAWNNGKPNIFMKQFMQKCIDNDIKQGLISTTITYKHAQGKVEWVKENYGVELENYCVGTFEAKLDMMLAIADAYNYTHDEILIVDDFWENLERAANIGFQACSPMEIVNFIEEINKK